MKKKHSLFYTVVSWIVAWLVLLSALPVHAAEPGTTIPNASGGLRIGVAQSSNNTIIFLDEPALVKTVFDQGWMRVRDEWNSRVVHFIDEMLHEIDGQMTIEVVSDLATMAQAELRVTKIDQGASLRYIVHDNQMRLALSWPPLKLSYVVTFDIELVLAVQASNQGQRLQIADAAISMENTRIEGIGVLSDLMLPLIEAVFHEVENAVEQANSALAPLLSEFGAQFTLLLSPIWEQIPSTAVYTEIGVEPDTGTIALCFKSNAKHTCRFPITGR